MTRKVFTAPAVIITLIVSILVPSCVSRKDVAYFQPKEHSGDSEKTTVQTQFVHKLGSGDILGIMVASLSPEASALFNPFPAVLNSTMNQTNQTNAPAAATGYMVDLEGNITIPLIGKLNVKGYTTAQLTDTLSIKLIKYLKEPTVSVRVLNFRVSIMGEVNRPSVYTIPNEKITLPEALSLAGDLTIYGNRKNILVIREVNGQREFARIDLTKRDFFNSPYYYLQSNDLVYVEPGKGKYNSTDRTVQLAPIVISSLTLMTLIYSAFVR
ncbi:MAG: polysaccharide biosynthesis/export family protein [Bacteroidia bacterium]|nr:polysaccharide biosynthesis/export family protein [Bacteroidia bacterium]